MAGKPREVILGSKTKAQIIREIALQNPEYGHTQIARMVGSDASYVYNVRNRAGLLFDASYKPVIVHLERQNNVWVTNRAKDYGLTTEEFVNLVITDARLEEADE